jgi:hypothetical protein
MKKVITILILLFNVLIHRKHYKLQFDAEDMGAFRRWYYHFPLWGFSHDNLEMVSGAELMCEKYITIGTKTTVVDIIASRKDLGDIPSYDHFKATDDLKGKPLFDRITLGRNYRGEKGDFWICPVTLFVLGRYPKHLYIKKLEKYEDC